MTDHRIRFVNKLLLEGSTSALQVFGGILQASSSLDACPSASGTLAALPAHIFPYTHTQPCPCALRQPCAVKESTGTRQNREIYFKNAL